MKFILLSDCHILWNKPTSRLDDTKSTGLRKLEYVLKFAKKENGIVLQAGDFVDKERSWYLLPELIRLLREYDVPVYMVRGQHDNYMYSEQTNPATTVGVLEKMGLVTILGKEPIKINVRHDDENYVAPFNIYGASFGREIPKVQRKKNNVLVIHAPIAAESPYYSAKYMDAGKFLQKHKDFDLILCGDIHRKFNIERDNRHIVNTGSMIRKEATEYNFMHKPGFFVWDTNTLGWHVIPHLKAEKVLRKEDIAESEKLDNLFDDFISTMEKTNDEYKEGENTLETIRQTIQRIIETNKFGQEVTDVLSSVMGEDK